MWNVAPLPLWADEVVRCYACMTRAMCFEKPVELNMEWNHTCKKITHKSDKSDLLT